MLINEMELYTKPSKTAKALQLYALRDVSDSSWSFSKSVEIYGVMLRDTIIDGGAAQVWISWRKWIGNQQQ